LDSKFSAFSRGNRLQREYLKTNDQMVFEIRSSLPLADAFLLESSINRLIEPGLTISRNQGIFFGVYLENNSVVKAGTKTISYLVQKYPLRIS
jgi:hypothetical protein